MACNGGIVNIWMNDLCRTVLCLKHSISLKYSSQTGFVIVLLCAPTKINVSFKKLCLSVHSQCLRRVAPWAPQPLSQCKVVFEAVFRE